MNAERKRLVLESWQSVAADRDGIATAFYERLFEIHPPARQLFARTNMTEQRVKVMTMLDDIVRNLDPWYAAFDVRPGQALYLDPKDRVRVW